MRNKIYIAGIDGMVGESLGACFSGDSKYNVIGTTYKNLDLLDYTKVYNYLKAQEPDVIILAAAKVGGGHAISSSPVEFLEDNIVMQINIMRAANELGINKVIFIASSALYPTTAMNPIEETSIFEGKLDSIQESYGLAKLVGLYQTNYYNAQYNRKFITVVLNNVIGPRDNGQVVYSLIKQMVQAEEKQQDTITLWGSGEQRREFIFVEDVARAIKLLVDKYDELEDSVYNIGVQSDISIKELAFTIKDITNYSGELVFDATKPEGVKKRVLNSDRIFSLGFKPQVTLNQGLEYIYENQFNKGMEVSV